MIIDNGVESFVGCVYGESEHMWMDGMLETYAEIWDCETHESKVVSVGYYGADGHNLSGMTSTVDICAEVARDMIRTYKQKAAKAFCESVTEYKTTPRKGSCCEVIRGRKVPKGTKVTVFWTGERETYRSRQSSWMHETEEVAGCHDEAGNKLWIKLEYLKVLDEIASPKADERKKFIRSYIERNVPRNVLRVARG